MGQLVLQATTFVLNDYGFSAGRAVERPPYCAFERQAAEHLTRRLRDRPKFSPLLLSVLEMTQRPQFGDEPALLCSQRDTR